MGRVANQKPCGIKIESAIDCTPCFEIMELGAIVSQNLDIVIGKVNLAN